MALVANLFQTPEHNAYSFTLTANRYSNCIL